MHTGRAAEQAVATWRGELGRFQEDGHWRSWRTVRSLRMLLCRLHAIIDATPPNLLQRFDRFDESDLAATAGNRMAHLDAMEPLTAEMPDVKVLFNAAAALRALDKLLSESAEEVAIDRPECWLTGDGSAYVIPVPRPVLVEGGPKTHQNFSRRGILHHRIIPTRVADVDIIVEPHPDVTEIADGVDGVERIFGAAIFHGFDLGYDEPASGTFIVTEVNCAGGIGAAVGRHCADARRKGCDTIVWPELTMSPASVRVVQEELADQPLTTPLPPVVVAGSWHVEQAGAFHNLAPVLDGRGGELFTFGKSRLFTFNGLTEHIEPYKAVHIVVTDRELIAFAICKDFCDKARGVPVRGLDVDYVLVPSMGQAGTMTSHRDAADEMKILFGTRTTVVQQHYPAKQGSPPGFVLKAPKDPRAATIATLAERLEFTTFQRE